MTRLTELILISALVSVVAVGPSSAADPSPSESSLPQAEATPLLSYPTGIGTVEYAPGSGLRIGNSGLSLGGYASVNVERPEGGPGRLQLEDLSLFVTWHPLPRFHVFAELEGEELLGIDDHGHGGTSDAGFVVERLYGSLALSDHLNLRLGQFLTPVGRWNLIHAQPLVWTTSRPLSTIDAFDTHTTGAMLDGTLLDGESQLTYAIYGQFVDALDRPQDQPVHAKRSAGLRIGWQLESQASVGMSYVAQHYDGEWDHITGIDASLDLERLELWSEAVVATPDGQRPQQWGGYLQAAFALGRGVYAVARYEHYALRAPEPEVNLIVPALAYRPTAYAVFKIEYVIADRFNHSSPPGFFSSFSLLF